MGNIVNLGIEEIEESKGRIRGDRRERLKQQFNRYLLK